MRVMRGLAVTFALLAVAACSSGSAVDSGNDNTSTVGPKGGTVKSMDGVVIQFGMGAVSSDLTVTISPSSSTPPDAVGPAYDLGPEGATFSAPVLVTLPFNPAMIPAGRATSDVVVFTAPKGSSAFTSLGGTLVDGTHVQAATTHFSIFGAGLRPTPDAGAHDAGIMCCPGGTCVKEGEACPGGGACINGMCLPCGTGGQPCCGGMCTGGGCCVAGGCIDAKQACSDTEVCQGDGGCTSCGESGGACCPANRCLNGGCCVASAPMAPGTCVAAGASCAPLQGTCSAGQCGGGTCGGLDQACCSSCMNGCGQCTAANTICPFMSDAGICVACGGSGQTCCYGGVCAPGFDCLQNMCR